MPETPDNPAAGGEFQLPEGFSAADFQTPQQEILCGAFAQLARSNEERIENFDPHGAGVASEMIGLQTAFPEIEAAEPTLAAQQRFAMLIRLGIPAAFMEEGDPDVMYQFIGDDKSFLQFRRIARRDGTSVAVRIFLNGQQQLDSLDIVADEFAQQEIAQFGAADILGRLSSLLDITGDELSGQAAGNLTTEDLKAMLAQLESLRGREPELNEQIEQGKEAIRKARKRYAATVMPVMQILEEEAGERLEESVRAYERALRVHLHALEYNPEHLREELAQEEGRRHEALNRRQRVRMAIARATMAASTLFADGIVMGAGAFVGSVSKSHTEAGLAIGTGGAAVFTAIQLWKGRKWLRQVADFTSSDNRIPPGSDVIMWQLDAELALAEANLTNIRNVTGRPQK